MSQLFISDETGEWSGPGENFERECVNFACSDRIEERTLRCASGHPNPPTAEQERVAWESDDCHCPPTDRLVIDGGDECFVCGGEIA